MEARIIFSENIKAIRRRRKLSLVQFAKELDISKSTLEQIEKGNPPNLATIEHIAGKLDTSVQAILSPGYAECVDLTHVFLNGCDMFNQLPPDQKPVFAEWAKRQIDVLLQFSGMIHVE